ncbi:hypothetical protein KCU99_g4599, partial [Aureobasidium melanogenum]
MRAATRIWSAILILATFFLIRTYLYRLPIAELFHGSDIKPLVGVGDDASTEVDETVGLASPSALGDERSQATATIQDGPSAAGTTTPTTSASPSASSLSSLDQIIVTGKTNSEDTSWVEKLPTWQNAVYSVDNDTWPLHTSGNKGREANVYLTYIIENYEELPLTIAFVHAHEGAWHIDADGNSNVKSLSSLNFDFVQRNGYVNLRCIASPGCPDGMRPFHDYHDEEDRRAEHAIADVWKELFGDNDVPEVIGATCCAQFAVSRDQVRKRPLEFYVGALKWLHETPLDDATSGRVLEHIWHIIFGKDPVYCPDLDQCYHDVYGRVTYGHSQLKTGHPVRSAIHKQLNGRLVLRWVTTWESLLL